MTGKMLTIEVPWYDTRIENCSYCGKMIARNYWADDDYPDDKFCEPQCADVKRRAPQETGSGARP